MKIDPNHLMRYFAVGVLNTCIAYGTFSLLLWLGVYYTWATLLGGICAMLAGYKFMRELVFKSKSKHAFIKFILIFIVMYFTSILIQFALQKTLNSYIAGAIASLTCALLSYSVNRKFVFGFRASSAVHRNGVNKIN